MIYKAPLLPWLSIGLFDKGRWHNFSFNPDFGSWKAQTKEYISALRDNFQGLGQAKPAVLQAAP